MGRLFALISTNFAHSFLRRHRNISRLRIIRSTGTCLNKYVRAAVRSVCIISSFTFAWVPHTRRFIEADNFLVDITVPSVKKRGKGQPERPRRERFHWNDPIKRGCHLQPRLESSLYQSRVSSISAPQQVTVQMRSRYPYGRRYVSKLVYGRPFRVCYTNIRRGLRTW